MKKVIPFGDRILVRKKVVKDVKQSKDSVIILPDVVNERPTDLAVVVSIPELSLADEELINNSEQIILALSDKAKDGDSEALVSLLRFKIFLSVKAIKPGDEIMIGKYVGTTFQDTERSEPLTLVREDDIIGLVVTN